MTDEKRQNEEKAQKIRRAIKEEQEQSRDVSLEKQDVLRKQIRELEQDYRDLTGKKIAKSSDGDVEIEVLDI